MWQFPTRLNMHYVFNLATAFWDTYPKEMKLCVPSKTCTQNVYSSSIGKSQKVEKNPMSFNR